MKLVLKKINAILTKEDKKLIGYLIGFSLIISIVETLGVSIIMPFISLATNFELVETNKYYKVIYEYFSFDNEVNFVIFFGISLFLFYIFRSGFNLIYFYSLAKFSKSRYQIIVTRLFDKYLTMTYKNFVTKNSSTLTKTIVTEAYGFSEILSAVLLMVSEIFIILFIYGILLYVNYQITIVLTIFLLLNGLFLAKTISPRLKQTGIDNEKVMRHFYEIINKSFGNFKLIKLHTQDKEAVSIFSDASLKSSKLATYYTTFTQVPRLFLEALSFGLLTLIITYFVWSTEKNISEYLPILSIFVLSLYRLMPSVNRLMTSYNHIMYYNKALDIIYDDLFYESEKLGDDNISFSNSIEIRDVFFSYVENKSVLNNVNLKIDKGSKIAFIGESGGGKSTIVDLIIGLHSPSEGSLLIDNIKVSSSNVKNWRQKIGYIPQSVYLFDGTVAENVAFGETYNEERVITCLKRANIFDFLETKESLNTFVGEGGVMLSGGQKQRIAIARALYQEPEVLVLDEATSALDSTTEETIMNEIYKICEDKTLIIIAHRLSTIKKCDKIYEMKEGKINES